MAAADVRIGSAAESGTTGTPTNVLVTDGSEPFSPVIGTADVTLGALTVAATGLPVVSGTASISLGGLTLAATGSVTTQISGTADVSLGSLTLAATGTVSNQVSGTASISLGSLTLTATGTIPSDNTDSLPLALVLSEYFDVL